ncbi:Glycoside hydrolase [Mycena sanguinolenta]|uniref:Glycoside hydrolase n=1 Tax=Mycena sanguinolenta TaxID=230812 RepID=A0A8H6XRR7_9AGAR|nr:Glycoside hydrolase [Mycena sanguinolenta]
MTLDSLALTYGPLLFGGAVALMLSGIVAVQCILFFKLYPDESGFKTAMVATVWTLDVAQSAFIGASLFEYFISHFGDTTFLAVIPGPIACQKLTILLTATQTCLVHLFYAQRIHRSNGQNWLITGPIGCLAILRLAAAVAATVEMLRLGKWAAFSHPYPRFLFTTGLSLSAGTDAIITICLCYYLRKIRKRSSSSIMKGVMDALTLYTLENGLITCLFTIGSLTFWLVIPGTTLSLSLHFVIGKLYPNSLLMLLNKRKVLQEMHSSDEGVYVDTSKYLATYYTDFPHRVPLSHRIDRFPHTIPQPVYEYRPSFKMHQPQMEIKVQKTVRHEYTYEPASPDAQGSIYIPPRSLGNTSLHWRALP